MREKHNLWWISTEFAAAAAPPTASARPRVLLGACILDGLLFCEDRCQGLRDAVKLLLFWLTSHLHARFFDFWQWFWKKKNGNTGQRDPGGGWGLRNKKTVEEGEMKIINCSVQVIATVGSRGDTFATVSWQGHMHNGSVTHGVRLLDSCGSFTEVLWWLQIHTVQQPLRCFHMHEISRENVNYIITFMKRMRP